MYPNDDENLPTDRHGPGRNRHPGRLWRHPTIAHLTDRRYRRCTGRRGRWLDPEGRRPGADRPIGGARVDSLRPTLTWAPSSGTYATEGLSPTYDIEVMTGGAVVFTANVSGTSYQPTTNALNNTMYGWRVRARQDGATGPWSAEATFQTPVAAAGGLVTDGFRTPDPAPGTRLPLPVETGVVNDEYNRNVSDWQNSCQDRQGERGWVWIDKLIDRLRAKDLRWGYNGKRGNANDPSQDVIDYHYGAGSSQGSTQVYIIDVMFGHCGGSPGPTGSIRPRSPPPRTPWAATSIPAPDGRPSRDRRRPGAARHAADAGAVRQRR